MSLSRRSSSTSSSATLASWRTRGNFDKLVDQLIHQHQKNASPVLTRRVVMRLADATNPPTIMDPMAILQDMAKKVEEHGSAYYVDRHRVNIRIHEVYSRFCKLTGDDMRGKTLRLLHALMYSVPPPRGGSVGQRGGDAVPMEVDGSEVVPRAVKTTARASDFVHQLEDSFRVSVGIATSSRTGFGSSSPRRKSPGSGSKAKTMNAAANKTMGGDKAAPTMASSALKQQPSFDEVPEEVLLRDVLYAMQAIDSKHIFFDSAADRFQITRHAGVPTPMRELIHRLCELGWFYRKINAYLQHYRENLAFGVVGQSFCHAINLELSDYFRLVAVLSSQVDHDAETSHARGSKAGISDLTLRKLVVWVHDPLEKLRLIARLIDSVDGLRGGALASGIHSHILHGDPAVRNYVQDVMKAVAAPIFRMIRRWVFEGELDDTHREFFVVVAEGVSDDQMWRYKYQLKTEMLPSFISLELAQKILVIGKSINFIRQCCGNTDWIMDPRAHNNSLSAASAIVDFEENGHRFAQLTSLEKMIEDVSQSTNEYLIHSLTEKFHLLNHCRALRRYMLLGQGDFIQYLMDLLQPELSKVARGVHRHNLVNVLETALNASNAKFESADILARLDVELLRPSAGDLGWDVFSLHYKVPSPINTIINDAAMQQYQTIFLFLWQLKRVEHSLSTSWSKDMHLEHILKKDLSVLRPVILKSQMTRSEMIYFTTTLHNYVMFEVLETSWQELEVNIKSAKDLDSLITSHENYVQSIKEKGFMTEPLREILLKLKAIFGQIIGFCRAQDSLCTTAMQMHNKLQAHRRTIETNTKRGTWGSTIDEEAAVFETTRFDEAVRNVAKEIHNISAAFTDHVIQLLALLQKTSTSHTIANSHTLSSLMVRFDFNEFYHRKSHPESSGDGISE